MPKPVIIKLASEMLATPELILKTAKMIAEQAKISRVVVVVSTAFEEANEFSRLAAMLNHNFCSREQDLFACTAEQQVAALVTLSLQAIGLPARSFVGTQTGIVTDNCHGAANILRVHTYQLDRCLKQGVIPVVAGGQGHNEDGEVTIIGKNGADLTAISLASALNAERCDIYSSSSNLYTCDPELVFAAQRLRTVGADESVGLAQFGTPILCSQVVKWAKEHDVTVCIRSINEPQDEGTQILPRSPRRTFTGLGLKSNIQLIEIELERSESNKPKVLNDFPGRREKTRRQLAEVFAARNIDVVVVSSKALPSSKLLLHVASDQVEQALSLIQKTLPNSRGCVVRPELCSIGIVCENNADSCAQIEQLLLLHRIQPLATVRTHEGRFTVIVDKSSATTALNILHFHFVQTSVPAPRASSRMSFNLSSRLSSRLSQFLSIKLR